MRNADELIFIYANVLVLLKMRVRSFWLILSKVERKLSTIIKSSDGLAQRHLGWNVPRLPCVHAI